MTVSVYDWAKFSSDDDWSPWAQPSSSWQQFKWLIREGNDLEVWATNNSGGPHHSQIWDDSTEFQNGDIYDNNIIHGSFDVEDGKVIEAEAYEPDVGTIPMPFDAQEWYDAYGQEPRYRKLASENWNPYTPDNGEWPQEESPLEYFKYFVHPREGLHVWPVSTKDAPGYLSFDGLPSHRQEFERLYPESKGQREGRGVHLWDLPGLGRFTIDPTTGKMVDSEDYSGNQSGIPSNLERWYRNYKSNPQDAPESPQETPGATEPSGWTSSLHQSSESLEGLTEARKLADLHQLTDFHTDENPTPEWSKSDSLWSPQIPQRAYQEAIQKGKCFQCGSPLENRGDIFTCPGCPMEYELDPNFKLSMAERSGDPQLDTLIEEFIQLNPELGDGYDSWDEEGYVVPDKLDLMKDEFWSQNMCNLMAEKFDKFLKSKGVQVNDEMGQDTPTGEIYNDWHGEGTGSHCVSIAEMPSGTYSIDWTSSQYGYNEWPMVQRLGDSGWQREWTSRLAWISDQNNQSIDHLDQSDWFTRESADINELALDMMKQIVNRPDVQKIKQVYDLKMGHKTRGQQTGEIGGTFSSWHKANDEVWDNFNQTQPPARNAEELVNNLSQIPGVRRVNPIPNTDHPFNEGDQVRMEHAQGSLGTVLRAYPPGTARTRGYLDYMQVEPGEEPYGLATTEPTYDVQWHIPDEMLQRGYKPENHIGQMIDQSRLWPEGDWRLEMAYSSIMSDIWHTKSDKDLYNWHNTPWHQANFQHFGASIEDLAREQYESLLGNETEGHKPARADIQKYKDVYNLYRQRNEHADWTAEENEWNDKYRPTPEESAIIQNYFSRIRAGITPNMAFDDTVAALQIGQGLSGNSFTSQPGMTEQDAKRLVGQSLKKAEEHQYPRLYSGIKRELTELFHNSPESYKLWPWAVKQMKENWKDGLPWGSNDEHFYHLTDIIGEGGKILNDLRRENKLPQNFDVNQMSFDEFERWLMDWKRENREAEDQGEVVYQWDDGWTIQRLTTPEELQYEGDQCGHCVGGYASQVEAGETLIYSLRDPKGIPHVTMEIESPNLFQNKESYDDYEDKINSGHMMGNKSQYLTQVNPHNYQEGQDYTNVAGKPWDKSFYVVQVQGNSNHTPKPEYQAKIKDFLDFLRSKGFKFQRSDDWYAPYDEEQQQNWEDRITNHDELNDWYENHYQRNWDAYSGKSNNVDAYGMPLKVGLDSYAENWSDPISLINRVVESIREEGADWEEDAQAIYHLAIHAGNNLDYIADACEKAQQTLQDEVDKAYYSNPDYWISENEFYDEEGNLNEEAYEEAQDRNQNEFYNEYGATDGFKFLNYLYLLCTRRGDATPETLPDPNQGLKHLPRMDELQNEQHKEFEQAQQQSQSGNPGGFGTDSVDIPGTFSSWHSATNVTQKVGNEDWQSSRIVQHDYPKNWTPIPEGGASGMGKWLKHRTPYAYDTENDILHMGRPWMTHGDIERVLKPTYNVLDMWYPNNDVPQSSIASIYGAIDEAGNHEVWDKENPYYQQYFPRVEELVGRPIGNANPHISEDVDWNNPDSWKPTLTHVIYEDDWQSSNSSNSSQTKLGEANEPTWSEGIPNQAQKSLNPVWWPTYDDVVNGYHHSVNQSEDADLGFRDPSLIEGAIGNTQLAHQYGQYNDLYDIAAGLMDKIQRQQALNVANKRTGSMIGLQFLMEHGIDTIPIMSNPQLHDELIRLIYGLSDSIEKERTTEQELAQFLRENCPFDPQGFETLTHIHMHELAYLASKDPDSGHYARTRINGQNNAFSHVLSTESDNNISIEPLDGQTNNIWFDEDGQPHERMKPEWVKNQEGKYESTGPLYDTFLDKKGRQAEGYVAKHNGEPIGSLTYVPMGNDPDNPDKHMLGTAYVHPDHRQQGIFNQMMEPLRSSGGPIGGYVWNNNWLQRKVEGSAKLSEVADFSSVLKTFNQLKQTGVIPDFMLFGSVAAFAYIEHRTTKDIDIAIPANSDINSPEYVQYLTSINKSLGFQGANWNINFGGMALEVWPTDMKPVLVDAFSDAREVEMDGQPVKVASPERLIILALDAWRPVDMGRVAELLPSADITTLQGLLKTFDESGIYTQRLQSIEATQKIQSENDDWQSVTPQVAQQFEAKRKYHEANVKKSFEEKIKDLDYLLRYYASNDWRDYMDVTEDPYYYHAAPTRERDRILQHGLQPSKPQLNSIWGRGNKSDVLPPGEYAPGLLMQPEGIYTTHHPENTQYWGESYNEPYDIWKIPKNSIQVATNDPYSDGVVIQHPITNMELHEPYENLGWERREMEEKRELLERQLGEEVDDEDIDSLYEPDWYPAEEMPLPEYNIGQSTYSKLATITENPVNYKFIPFTDYENSLWKNVDSKAKEYWKNKAHHLNQYAMNKGADGRVNGAQLYILWNRYNGKCAYDGQHEGHSFDHVIPLGQGGTHTIDNLLPVHPDCNSKMNDWDKRLNPEQWQTVPTSWMKKLPEEFVPDNWVNQPDVPSNGQFPVTGNKGDSGNNWQPWEREPGEPVPYELVYS